MAEQATSHTAIKVTIAGRPYPVRIQPGEEDGLRAVVDEINERYHDFQTRFRDRDKQDWLVMTLLTYAGDMKALREAANGSQDEAIDRRLRQLTDLVEGVL